MRTVPQRGCDQVEGFCVSTLLPPRRAHGPIATPRSPSRSLETNPKPEHNNTEDHSYNTLERGIPPTSPSMSTTSYPRQRGRPRTA